MIPDFSPTFDLNCNFCCNDNNNLYTPEILKRVFPYAYVLNKQIAINWNIFINRTIQLEDKFDLIITDAPVPHIMYDELINELLTKNRGAITLSTEIIIARPFTPPKNLPPRLKTYKNLKNRITYIDYPISLPDDKKTKISLSDDKNQETSPSDDKKEEISQVDKLLQGLLSEEDFEKIDSTSSIEVKTAINRLAQKNFNEQPIEQSTDNKKADLIIEILDESKNEKTSITKTSTIFWQTIKILALLCAVLSIRLLTVRLFKAF